MFQLGPRICMLDRIKLDFRFIFETILLNGSFGLPHTSSKTSSVRLVEKLRSQLNH